MNNYKIGDKVIVLDTFDLAGAVKNKMYKIIAIDTDYAYTENDVWYLLNINGGTSYSLDKDTKGWWYQRRSLELTLIVGEQLEFAFMYEDEGQTIGKGGLTE